MEYRALLKGGSTMNVTTRKSAVLNREGESGFPPKRSSRFYQHQDSWFFNTREGSSIGPFYSAKEAKQGLTDFIDFIDLAPPKTRKRFFASLQA